MNLNKCIERNTTILVGVNGRRELVMVDRLFWHSETFHGVSGFVMDTLSLEDITERRNEDLTESADCRRIWAEAAEAGDTDASFADFVDEMVQGAYSDGCLFLFDDPSFRKDADNIWNGLAPEIVDKLESILGHRGTYDIDADDNLVSDNPGDWVEFSASSCGRCFPDNKGEMEVVFNDEMFDLLAEIDSNESMSPEEFMEKVERITQLRDELQYNYIG